MTQMTSAFRLVTEKLAALTGAAGNVGGVPSLALNAQMAFVSRLYACRIAPIGNVVMMDAAARADCVLTAFSARAQPGFVWALVRLPAREKTAVTMAVGILAEHVRQGQPVWIMFV